MKIFILVFSLTILVACQTKNKKHFTPPLYKDSYTLFSYSFVDFPNEDIRDFYGETKIEEFFEDIDRVRTGLIVNGFKEGKWLSGDVGFDSKRNANDKNKICREEYFKQGLRDSIYRIYKNGTNQILYETIFNNGTGLLKDYYDNGQLYYEIETKDGYFTDTLRLYDTDGRLMEKLLYQKDSLTYHERIYKSEQSSILPIKIKQND